MLICIALVPGFTLAIIEILFLKTEFAGVDVPAEKIIWSHRNNTIDLIQKTQSAGFQGIEFDARFDDQLNDFVISHDYPYEVFNGKTFTLTEILAAIHPQTLLWMDFKNLSSSNLKKSLQKLLELHQKFSLKPRLYVEGAHVNPLKEFSHNGFKTLFTVQDRPSSFLRGLRHDWTLKWQVINSGFTALAVNHRYMSSNIKTFSHLPTFVYTENNPQEIERFRSYPHIKVILTDLPSPELSKAY